MEVKKTKINGVFLIKPQIFKDKRGYFFESFNSKEFKKAIGFDGQFVQTYTPFGRLYNQIARHSPHTQWSNNWFSCTRYFKKGSPARAQEASPHFCGLIFGFQLP